MSTKKISELETTSAVSTSDLMETAIPSGSSYASKKMSIAQLATYLENSVVHSALDTTNKTIIDAINELKSICDNLSASHFIVANQLPTSDINMNAIYLIPKQSTGVNDVYEEYICLDDTTTPATWEKIGETQIDLSNYITFDDADIATTSKNGSMSKADRSKMNGIESGAQKNVQSDWNASSGDAFIKHKPTIPDELADLTDDSTHRLVTDTEKTTWNDKRAVNLELTNEDLDDVKTVGFYVGKNGNTCANKPSGFNQFGLIVVKSATSYDQYYKQILIRPNEEGEVWTRTCVRKNGNPIWSDWVQSKFTDEKVKQTEITDNKTFKSLAIASDNTTTTDTDGVEKCNGLAMRINKQIRPELAHAVELCIGNDIPVGSTDNYVGILRMFGTNEYSTTIHAGNSTDDREIVFPDADGTVALTSDLPTNPVLWSENNLLGAKNLITFPYYSGFNRTLNNVTFAVNNEGVITVGGTQASANTSFYLMYDVVLPNGTYTLSDGGVGTADTYLSLVYYTGGSSTANYIDVRTSGSVTFTAENWDRIRLRIWSRNGKTAANLVFKPMLRLSTISDSTFEPYAETNRQLTLSKLSWEENKASGVKNYINYPYNHPMQGETYTIRDVEYTDNGDGGIVANGTCDNTGNSYCQVLKTTSTSAGLHFCKLPKGRYHFSGGISDDYYMNLSRGLISNPSATRTEIGTDYGDGFDFDVTEQQANESYFCLFCFVAKNKTATNVVFYPMITRYEDSSQGYAEYAMTNAELTQIKADMDNIAPTETSGTAVNSYAVGDYMWWRHGFYRVTQAIAVGDSITTSKVTKTTLGAELKRALT